LFEGEKKENRRVWVKEEKKEIVDSRRGRVSTE
jgi:hypothetical protein